MIHKPTLSQIATFAGKGGVGKSTIAAATAIHHALAENKKTLVVDYDGGKAFARVIKHTTKEHNKIEQTAIDNLFLGTVIDPDEFVIRKECASYEEYIQQFPEDYGAIAFNQMLFEFFGGFTDTDTLYRYITLLRLFEQAQQDGFEKIVLDIEPTTGLKRLLSSTDRLSNSMHNLHKLGWGKIQLLGTAWKDVKEYLNDDYIKNVPHYMNKYVLGSESIKKANFSIVSIPEQDPLTQALEDVLGLIQKFKGDVKNIILNNYGRKGSNELHESKLEDRAQRKADEIGAALKLSHHKNGMMIDDKDTRLKVLQEIGEELAVQG